jgi:mono/diheme cytochrome c family protein
MLKPVVILTALLLPAFSSPTQENQTPPKEAPSAEYTIPVKAARELNPVKPTGESIARGKKLYGYDCAMCHGKDGYGKGDVATDLKLKISDFSDPAALKERTDGELFYIIKNGKGQMPPEGDRVKPDRIWDMVNYIRSFATTKPTPEEKSPASEEPN